MKAGNRSYGGMLIALCTACYFVSYLTRINYGAVLLEIERAEGISKVAASMAVTGSFITYGAGQLVSGWFGDRLKPEKMILAGLLTTACMNLLVPVFTEPGLILAFWCINGFAQAMIWPPMVRIMSACLDEDTYKKGVVRVTWGSSAGTIAVYLLAPACIRWKGWRSLFFVCAGAAVCFAFVWIKGIAAVRKRAGAAKVGGTEGTSRPGGRQSAPPVKGTGIDGRTQPAVRSSNRESQPKGLLSGIAVWVLALVMPAIVMQGILRDGITTWMPSYVASAFSMDSSSAILSGVVLPVFSIVCLEITSVLNRKFLKNELLCAGVVFLVGFCSSLLLALLPSVHVLVSVGLAALVTGCMYGVNVILVSMLPAFFKQNGKVSTISGLLNSCTYVGSALSSYGIAWVAQQKGWQSVLWLWALAALIGTMLCLLCVGRWKMFKQRTQT